MPRLLLLMTTTTYRASAFLDAARRLQVTVVVGSDQPQALEALTPGSTLTLDFFHPEQAARTITAFAAASPLDAVVGVDDDTTLTAAMAAEALGVLHNAVASVAAARNKRRDFRGVRSSYLYKIQSLARRAQQTQNSLLRPVAH